MTKEVLLKISGLQFNEGADDDPVEVITSADYYKKNGKHYLIYDEVAENRTDTTRNIIKLAPGMLDITKSGSSNVHMLFERGRKNTTFYYTPFGSLQVGIDAAKIETTESEDRIDVLVDYDLEVNYEHLAECKIRMEISSKSAGEFRI
jgi:uncharacterized beta-barrel protein YwiB (DUF1934 family)